MLYDAIIIGGGHNGLICASLLAKRNKKVIVCEARSELGGLCANESISNSSIPRIAHITSGLHPNVRSSWESLIQRQTNNSDQFVYQKQVNT